MQNFGYAIKQNRLKDDEMFTKSMRAALEHHFDNHEDCDPCWCQFHPNSKSKVDDAKREKMRSKDDLSYKLVYDACKEIHDSNMTVKNLWMLKHPYNLQKHEALNGAFAKVAPKNIIFCKTHTLFDRLSLVICIDSLGYKTCLKMANENDICG